MGEKEEREHTWLSGLWETQTEGKRDSEVISLQFVNIH